MMNPLEMVKFKGLKEFHDSFIFFSFCSTIVDEWALLQGN